MVRDVPKADELEKILKSIASRQKVQAFILETIKESSKNGQITVAEEFKQLMPANEAAEQSQTTPVENKPAK